MILTKMNRWLQLAFFLQIAHVFRLLWPVWITYNINFIITSQVRVNRVHVFTMTIMWPICTWEVTTGLTSVRAQNVEFKLKFQSSKTNSTRTKVEVIFYVFKKYRFITYIVFLKLKYSIKQCPQCLLRQCKNYFFLRN